MIKTLKTAAAHLKLPKLHLHIDLPQLHIKPQTTQPSAKPPRVPAKYREYFTTNLASLSKAGLPLTWALQTLHDNTKSKALKVTVKQMMRDLDEGMPFWKALERGHMVSAETLMLVRIGEQSGNLPANLRLAADQEEKQRIFHAKIRTALLYPGFVLGTTTFVGIGIAWFLLPRLAATFEGLGLKLPLISRIILGLGTFLQHHGLAFVGLLATVVVIAGICIKSIPAVRQTARRTLMYIPGISRLMREVELARFGYLLGGLLNSGISVTESLNLLRGATSEPSYQTFYEHLASSFDEGFNFRTAFGEHKQSARLIPGPVQQMIIAAEYSGTLSEVLQNIGKMYEEKANITAGNLEVMIEPILLVLVWVGVLGVAIGVILPIYSLVGGVNKIQ